MSYLEMAIVAFILLGIAVAIWSGGQANPEGTGRLARRLSKVEQALDGRATARDVGDLRHEVAALKTQVGKLEAEMAGDRRVNQLTYEAVRRLEAFFIQKGTQA